MSKKVKNNNSQENLFLIDIISCGLGAVLLLLIFVDINADKDNSGHKVLDNYKKEIVRQSQINTNLSNELLELDNQKTKIKTLIEKDNEKLAILQRNKEQIQNFQEDIFKKLKNEESQNIQPKKVTKKFKKDEIIGFEIKGKKLLFLFDMSSSMYAQDIVEIIEYKNSNKSIQNKSKKLNQTRRILKWLIDNKPENSKYKIIAYNEKLNDLGISGYTSDTSKGTNLYQKFLKIMPSGGSNLHNALNEVHKYKPDEVFIVTDGLPTLGEKSLFNKLNFFSKCPSISSNGKLISSGCRAKLFQKSIENNISMNVRYNIILLALEGDPLSVIYYSNLANSTKGIMVSPNTEWP